MKNAVGSCRVRAHSLISFLVAASTAILFPVELMAGPIDLNQLFREDNAPIQIAADGSRAVLSEDPAIGIVFLSNVPAFDDLTLVTPAVGLNLLFDFDFSEAGGSADLFHFALLNGETGDALTAAAFNLFVNDAGSGSASFDLSSLVGSILGIQFELVHPGDDANSDATLMISNLRLEAASTEPPVTTPEPSSLALFSLGVLLVTIPLRRKYRRYSTKPSFV